MTALGQVEMGVEALVLAVHRQVADPGRQVVAVAQGPVGRLLAVRAE